MHLTCLMYFSGRQLYSHNRLQRSVHLQDLLWSRKVCIKVYNKTVWYLANELKLQVEKKMETCLTLQYQNQSSVDFHLCLFGRLFRLKQCFCLFFYCFTKQSDPRLFVLYSVFSPTTCNIWRSITARQFLNFSLFCSTHIFYTLLFKTSINTGRNMFKHCKCHYLNMENITSTG